MVYIPDTRKGTSFLLPIVRVVLCPVVNSVPEIACRIVRIDVREFLDNGVRPSILGEILFNEIVPSCDSVVLCGGCPVKHKGFVESGHDLHLWQSDLFQQALVTPNTKPDCFLPIPG